MVTVTVSNLVSSASLSSSIFVVDRPCQPPPVKNMGPLRLQVHSPMGLHRCRGPSVTSPHPVL